MENNNPIMVSIIEMEDQEWANLRASGTWNGKMPKVDMSWKARMLRSRRYSKWVRRPATSLIFWMAKLFDVYLDD